MTVTGPTLTNVGGKCQTQMHSTPSSPLRDRTDQPFRETRHGQDLEDDVRVPSVAGVPRSLRGRHWGARDGSVRPGNAGSNTAADHIAVLDDALAQILAYLRQPDEHGKVKVLVRHRCRWRHTLVHCSHTASMIVPTGAGGSC